MRRKLGSDTIVIQTPTEEIDPADNTTIVHFNPPASEVEVKNCSVQPFLLAEKLQFEITSERLYARSTMRVFAPTTPDTLAVSPEKRVVFNNRTYEVFGHLGVWTSIRGAPDHVAFIIVLREG